MEPMHISELAARCDGKGGDINATNSVNNGHPTIYLHLPPKGVVHCPYCSRSFVFKINLK
ncbi:MAG: zinc-finger domain-containing protein [Candidatus Paracaedibacteraceae bacterium]|nr:zinc-finger domain-containing protein [Candidatus Paracaedibacteraceae bacterium]